MPSVQWCMMGIIYYYCIVLSNISEEKTVLNLFLLL